MHWVIDHKRDLLHVLSNTRLTADERLAILRESRNILVARFARAGITLTFED